MQNRVKTLIFGLVAAAGLFAAVPAIAQTYNPGYSTNSSYPYTYTQPVYNYCPTITYNLVRGSSDYNTQGQVSQLQNFLRNRYNDPRVTGGYYGSLTASYVARFQQEMGVYPTTGGVGPMTRVAIQRACGGSVYPTPTPVPTPVSSSTFRLDRNFSLAPGQSAQLQNGQLDMTLNQLVSPYSYSYYRADPTSVSITLGLRCNSGTYCFYYPSQTYTLEEGDDVDFQGYNVELVSLTSSKATFRVTDNGNSDNNNDASIDVTRPTSSNDVDQGDTQKITWNSSDEPSNSSVILELYTSNSRLVGTIAVSSDTDGSYSWHVPERNIYCTMQYPNGLCGYDLDGSYYVKASLVRGNGFDGGTVLDSDTSGTFDINR
ncbi:MAG TPA: peptidoglycan-binding protein [Candidatus Paceibacterota bacterium]|jgi:peptidoglycan hydrolase-like protein with peptidoglycan-binding domain|nr:peptidoglycan-binding protein [Candidatus Paceibacterota bacterium]